MHIYLIFNTIVINHNNYIYEYVVGTYFFWQQLMFKACIIEYSHI